MLHIRFIVATLAFTMRAYYNYYETPNCVTTAKRGNV